MIVVPVRQPVVDTLDGYVRMLAASWQVFVWSEMGVVHVCHNTMRAVSLAEAIATHVEWARTELVVVEWVSDRKRRHAPAAMRARCKQLTSGHHIQNFRCQRWLNKHNVVRLHFVFLRMFLTSVGNLMLPCIARRMWSVLMRFVALRLASPANFAAVLRNFPSCSASVKPSPPHWFRSF